MPISRNATQIQILILADGFQVTQGNRLVWKVRFDEIERIEGYKRDEITSDLLCLDIWTNGRGQAMGWVHEDMAGFDALEGRLKRLSGFDAGWRARVVAPAFAESRVLVYERI